MLIEPEAKILSIIDKRGYIHLDEFIEISLNKLELSYYKSRSPLGKNGDFITAPEISQLYGEIIGLFIANYIKENHLKEFNLIELGPGKGTLMKDIVRVLSTIFKNKIGRIRDIQVHPNNGKIYFLAGDKLWLMEKN